VRAFLDRADLTAATARAYGQTLRRLRLSEGDGVPVAALSGDRVTQVFATAWSGASAATWNRHLSAVRTFCAWTDLDDLTAAVDRRAAVADRAQRIDPAQVDALLDRPDVALRERTLWRLLHESAAPITTVLALNVEDLDLDDRRARAAGIWVTWRAATARLLPELLAGRTRGPFFLAGRRPAPARAPEPEDLCPQTGRRRLSYERSEHLFKQATRTLDPARNGYTLRQLRPRPR
jgi:hypothetical protein